ncbi:hypothetical protein PV08_06881 [Exophiala spinifera]|uniref:Uncharacterized protein n=1 Tax=Exophiala spinifera TaxID=91928 RepID=A0A0D2B602_9EURO|nr:uncharacterized protein PV08_06881 [Exophiala spinifera]KIW14100.1 hypothetical protein PV08_06881 [Exophiala spinifera]
MEKVPGKCLADAWRGMEYEAKERLVRQMASYSSELFRNQLRGIGNIYPDLSSPHSSAPPEVKRIVSMQFLWGNHIMRQDVRRGPFHSSKAWVSSLLSLSEHDCIGVLNSSGGIKDSDIEDAERTLRIVRRLKSHIIEFFPNDECGQGEDPEPSMLYHDDLSMRNILVNEKGDLAGVVDWEYVSALPLWKACYYPFFLQRRPRNDKPDRNKYRQEEDGNPNSLYWEHLMEYERTKLRRYFLDEMRRLEPKWIKVFDSSTAKRDFYLAAENCDNEFLARDITEWRDDVSARRGIVRSLRDRFDES